MKFSEARKLVFRLYPAFIFHFWEEGPNMYCQRRGKTGRLIGPVYEVKPEGIKEINGMEPPREDREDSEGKVMIQRQLGSY